MPKRDKLKVKQVVREYIKNGANMLDALKTVEGNKEYQHDGSLAVKATRWRFCPEVQEELRVQLAKFDKGIVNDIYVLANLYEIVNDKDIKTSDKVQALGLIAKVLNISKDGSNTQVNIYTDLLQDYKTAVDVKSIIPEKVESAVIVPNNTSVNLTDNTQHTDTTTLTVNT